MDSAVKPGSLPGYFLYNFKEINDRYPHVIGDRILQQVVSLMEEEIRDADTVVRYGGDEFLVLFPETGKLDPSNPNPRDRKLPSVR